MTREGTNDTIVERLVPNVPDRTCNPKLGYPPMQRKEIEANLSADLVRYLQKRGMTFRQIAETIGLSVPFISRVANKKRSLTIEHLLRIEDALGIPLPLLLLEVSAQGAVPERLAPFYERARTVLSAGSELESLFRQSDQPQNPQRQTTDVHKRSKVRRPSSRRCGKKKQAKKSVTQIVHATGNATSFA